MTDTQRAAIDSATGTLRDALRTFATATLPPLADAVQAACDAAGGFPVTGGLQSTDAAFYRAAVVYLTGLQANGAYSGRSLSW
jgi:hypothetical protein